MESSLPAWFVIVSLSLLTAILLADLALVIRRPHVPTVRECAVWVGFYVALALAFGGAVLVAAGPEMAGEFVAGWLTEYSLSVDNLFVFLLIFGMFAVPEGLQQGALMIGIILSLVLRAMFIVLGAELIAAFSWMFYVFGAFLIYTAIQQAFAGSDESGGDSGFAGFLRRRLRIAPEFNGYRPTVVQDGRRMFTPMLAVFLSLGVMNMLFAFDSIPAIFGITTSAFLVLAANILALMGLRQLYFLLGQLLSKLEFLKYGISVILGFIGIKLVLDALADNSLSFINGGHPVAWAPHIGTVASLVVIVVAIAGTVAASVVKNALTRTSAP